MWLSSSPSFPQASPLFLCKQNLHSSLSLIKSPNARGEVGHVNSSEATPSILPFHVKSITSTSNPFVKHCVKLRNSSSYRHSHGSVLLVGTTPLREMYNFQGSMQENTATIDCLLLHEKASVPKELAESGIHVVRVNSAVMTKLSGVQSTESIDIISLDPGNLGTLIRSAVAFGWNGVFLLPGCCDPFNEKALRASRGAALQLPMVCGQWSHLQSFINGLQMKIIAGHPGGNDEHKPVSCLSYELARSLTDTKLCLVLGSEGSGLSEEAKRVSELVSITMAGEFESLNVSVAGGIFLFMLQPQNKNIDITN